MSDESAIGHDDRVASDTYEPEQTRGRSRWIGGRSRVIVIALLVVGLAAAGYLFSRASVPIGPRSRFTESPEAVLDAALSDGMPAYILIHSAT